MTENQWDKVYSTKGMAMYPDNMLVRFVARNYYNVPDRKEVKFLDLGCGIGSSTWYLAREGFTVAAVDGSIKALERLRKRLIDENLQAILVNSDLTKLEVVPDFFDCAVDVSSLCYVPEDKIKDVLKKVHISLKPGGRIFSIAPSVSCDHQAFDTFVEGVKFDARYINFKDIVRIYGDLFSVNASKYSYKSGEREIQLWVVDGVKASS